MPVTVGQISRVDLTLAVGNLSEVVTVQSAAELLQTDKADTHTELNSTEITNLPLNQFRNYQALWCSCRARCRRRFRTPRPTRRSVR